MKREDILRVFSVLGKHKNLGREDRLQYYEVPFWETPSFSPIYLNEGCEIKTQDLIEIEDYFNKHAIKNPYIKHSPYCLIDIQTQKQKERYDRICKEHGWCIEEKPLHINILCEEIPVLLPPQICLKIIDSTDWVESYSNLLKNGFGVNKQDIQAIRNIYIVDKLKTFIVLIIDKEDKVVGAGMVSIKGNVGFLTWGTIDVEFRNQGYHNLLLTGCTMVARASGAKYIGYTTRNQYILDKRDCGLEMYICRKVHL